ncbi:hypothetical protein [Phaeovulum sp. NW3]|uniref:hypothetical protein n=1 Tax=Phaeovulum sp. NW3 TaxID=2934933 RepID=UPI002021DCC8|nr:hypothetical protein [Phaeovulum sp. NW3]MCL7465392.1 hypothetical protein [Phaeovulum sp. NW3]
MKRIAAAVLVAWGAGAAFGDVPALSPAHDTTISYNMQGTRVRDGVTRDIPYSKTRYTGYFATTGASVTSEMGQPALLRPDLGRRYFGTLDPQGRFIVVLEDDLSFTTLDIYREDLEEAGADTVAGEACTVWTAAIPPKHPREAASEAEFCVTEDGLMLRARITSILGANETRVMLIEATDVTRGPIPASYFEPVK